MHEQPACTPTCKKEKTHVPFSNESRDQHVNKHRFSITQSAVHTLDVTWGLLNTSVKKTKVHCTWIVFVHSVICEQGYIILY